MITIVDYNAGNIRSIENMLRYLGIPSQIASDAETIASAERLILPGVGHFDFGMGELIKRDLVEVLRTQVLERGVPILGICLGAQLLTRGSAEGSREGLGFLRGETVAFDRSRMPANLRVPHIGWSQTRVSGETTIVPTELSPMRFYYVHSYHLVCDEPEEATLHATYGYEFVAGFQSGSVFGVQFHPEKSHRYGMEVLKAYATWGTERAEPATASARAR